MKNHTGIARLFLDNCRGIGSPVKNRVGNSETCATDGPQKLTPRELEKAVKISSGMEWNRKKRAPDSGAPKKSGLLPDDDQLPGLLSAFEIEPDKIGSGREPEAVFRPAVPGDAMAARRLSTVDEGPERRARR